MTAKLQNVMAYIIKKYPDNLAGEMSNARLTKMVYLVDWKNALGQGAQITEIQWYFDNYGPFVNDVENAAKANPDVFVIDLGSNMYGQPKKTFRLREGQTKVHLSDAEKQSIELVIEETRKLYWKDFIRLVYSTHPVASSERYTYLDLVEKAKEYTAMKQKRFNDISF